MPTILPSPSQYTLLYTDTDSLIYKIQTTDLYSKFACHPSLFDFSDYDASHICSKNNPYLKMNKKKIGVIKDELGSLRITKFIALRSKLYSFKIAKEDEKAAESKNINSCKCKGVKQNVT